MRNVVRKLWGGVFEQVAPRWSSSARGLLNFPRYCLSPENMLIWGYLHSKSRYKIKTSRGKFGYFGKEQVFFARALALASLRLVLLCRYNFVIKKRHFFIISLIKRLAHNECIQVTAKISSLGHKVIFSSIPKAHGSSVFYGYICLFMDPVQVLIRPCVRGWFPDRTTFARHITDYS